MLHKNWTIWGIFCQLSGGGGVCLISGQKTLLQALLTIIDAYIFLTVCTNRFLNLTGMVNLMKWRAQTLSVHLGGSVALRGECSSLEAHLSAIAESQVRIPAPCKYCNAASVAAAADAEQAAAEAAKNRNDQMPPKTKQKQSIFTATTK